VSVSRIAREASSPLPENSGEIQAQTQPIGFHRFGTSKLAGPAIDSLGCIVTPPFGKNCARDAKNSSSASRGFHCKVPEYCDIVNTRV
jgi:hypothetical protein